MGRWTGVTEEDRFLEKVNRSVDSGCWIWAGYKNKKGYGVHSYALKKHDLAHRRSWKIFRGEIPDGLCVCHACDVRACVNPDHLFLGTIYQNNQDMFSKGRHRALAGEKHPGNKLRENDVASIKKSAAKGTELAKTFGVSPSLISSIRKNKVWKNVSV